MQSAFNMMNTTRFFVVPLVSAFLLLGTWVMAPALAELAPEPRIIDGTDADITEYPWQVSLLNNLPGTYHDRHFCGGSIIDERWVLTAAHCVVGRTIAGNVVAGLSNLDTDTGGQVVPVLNQYVHPDYNPDTSENDIALLQLSEPLDLSTAQAQPIPIMTDFAVDQGLDVPGVVARISGWGNTSQTLPPVYPPQLQQAVVPILDNEDPGLTLLLCDNFPESMLVAGFVDGGADSCQADSGGPLVVADDRTLVGYRLAGATSWGCGCGLAGFPGIYTRVSYYQDWIQEYVVNTFDFYGPQIQMMYVAYYGRPGDFPGLSYWTNELGEENAESLQDLINAFGHSPEFTVRFGMLSDEALVENLFLSLFNRSVDADGLAYYVDLLNGSNTSGFNPHLLLVTMGEIVLQIMYGAQQDSEDHLSMQNKLAVAQYFTAAAHAAGHDYNDSDIPSVVTILSSVGHDPASVVAAKAEIDVYLSTASS